ncbi:MAG: site-2 protease family protein [Polyangiales bacterium]
MKVHVSFALVLVLGAWQWGRGFGVRGALFGMLLMLLLFVCVTLHELAHGLVARSFQLPADEIVLYPFGGAAQIEGDAPKPMQELLVAIAGPAMNVMIAALLFIATSADFRLAKLNGEEITRATLLEPSRTTLLVWLLSTNVMMAVFNMIPALPLDGGRVLRAMLAMRLRAKTATLIAAGMGQIFSLAMGVYAVDTANYTLALVALVIFLGATAEQKPPSRRSILHTLRVGDVFNRDARVLSPADKVSHVIDYILTSYQPDFAVFEGPKLVGVITRRSVLDALSKDTRDQDVGAVMDRSPVRVDAGAPLDEVHERMQREQIPIVAVMGPKGYLGLVSMEDIAEARLLAGYVQRQTDVQIRTT